MRPRVNSAKGSGKQVRVPAFGRYLAQCRERHGSGHKAPSVEAVCRVLRDRFQVDVNDATLRGYEYGWVDRPDPVVLDALASFYRKDVSGLIAVLAANRAKKELSDVEVEQVLRRVSVTRSENAAAAARLSEIRRRIVDVGRELVELAAAPDLGHEAPETREDQSRTRGGDRETG